MRVFVIFSVICVVFVGEILAQNSEDEEIEASEDDENVVVLFGLDRLRGIRAVPYDYKVEDAENFVKKLQHQMKCGYPKFGIPSFTPLEFSYRYKQSFEIMGQKIQMTSADYTITGLDNFSIIYDNTTITNKRADVHLNFPEVTFSTKTVLDKNDGFLDFKMQNVDLIFYATYDERRNILSIKEINERVVLGNTILNLTNMFPTNPALTEIWNNAIADSIPHLVKMYFDNEIQVDSITKLRNAAKFFATGVINNGLRSYKLNFDGVVSSFQRFTEGTVDSLQCDAAKNIELDESLFKNVHFDF